MTGKSGVSKLVPRVPKVPGVPSVPGVSRRQAYSASTKRALVDVAEQLFTEHGYAGTPLEAVVGGAQVTKGALYHHFSGKQALFEAVFERLVTASATTISAAVQGERDPWARARAGLTSYLQVVEQPAYRRIVVQEGPAVLGYERFREQEESTTFGVLADLARTVLTASSWDLDEETVLTFARVFFGAMSAAGESVTAAEDPAAEALRVETVIDTLLAGLQALSTAGAPLGRLGDPT